MKRSGEGQTESILRAKHLDYCSARVADALLQMTPDEMYLLAQSAALESSPTGERAIPFSEIVRLATGRISTRLSLPDFQSWKEEYLKDPQRFEAELLGLWETESKRTPST